MNNIISLGLQHRWRRYAMRQAHFLPGNTVLDLCCGTGDWTVALASSIGRNGQVTGVNFSKAMVELAQQKIADNNLTNEVTVSFGEALHLPFPDDSFDLITIGFGMRNLADLNAGFEDVHYRRFTFGAAACHTGIKPAK